MAWQQSDLDTLRAAYIRVASGAQKVRYADGREVTYHSPDQVAAAIKVVEANLLMAERAASGLTRRRFGVFRRGT
jgi:hypothetical protein